MQHNLVVVKPGATEEIGVRHPIGDVDDTVAIEIEPEEVDDPRQVILGEVRKVSAEELANWQAVATGLRVDRWRD